MKRYGLPYKGSKNAIARAIIETLPEADIFIDLFAGGCAVTHAAMESGKYRRVIANDICTYPQFFKECIEGKHTIQTHPEWISRDDFFRLKDTSDYVKYVWSFGNNGCDYLYSKEIEPWKRALHLARAQGDFSGMKAFGIETDGSRADIVAHKDEYKVKYIKWYMKNVLMSEREYEIEKQNLEGKIKDESEKLRAYLIKARDDAGYKSSDVDIYLGTNGMAGHYYGRSQWEFPTREVYIRLQQIMPGLNQDYDDIAGLAILRQSLERLESLQSLERLQSLESLGSLGSLERLGRLGRLERLERLLTVTQTDFTQVKIPDNAIVYCDIPYRGTNCGAYGGFDHERFYEWAKGRDNIFISEYSMPPGFIRYTGFKKTVLSSGTGSTKAAEIEGLFTTPETIERVGGMYEQLSLFG